MALGKDSIGTGAKDVWAAFLKNPAQLTIVIFLVMCCGATKKFQTFPMPWIAGRSECEKIVPWETLDYSNNFVSYPTDQHPNAPYGVRVETYRTKERGCVEKAQVFTFIEESFTLTTANLVFFGFTKAIFNFVTGACCDYFGRKWTLVLGWVLAIPMPFMVIFATSWWSVATSNIFLGMQQALVWSTTIFMMVDFFGQKHSGWAIGLNETIGYTTMAIVNVIAGAILNEDFPRAENYYVVAGLIIVGIVFGSLFLKESKHLAVQEEADITGRWPDEVEEQKMSTMTWPSGRTAEVPLARGSFVYTSFVNTSLASICIAGLMINFVSGFAWGLFVKWMKDDYMGDNAQLKWAAIDKDTISTIVLCYGLPKGLLQWGCGFLGDRIGRKWLIVGGLGVVSLGLMVVAIAGETSSNPIAGFYLGSLLMGIGTGIMYTNNLAAICDHCDPSWRSSALGAYRFWRDSGYAIGALLTGMFADAIGTGGSVIMTMVLTILSAVTVAYLYQEVHPHVLGEKNENHSNVHAPDELEREVTLDLPIEESL